MSPGSAKRHPGKKDNVPGPLAAEGGEEGEEMMAFFDPGWRFADPGL